MINWIMKKSGDIALKTDVGKLDLSRLPEDVTEIKDISYADDNDPGHKLDIFVRMDGSKKPILIDIHGGGFISEDKGRQGNEQVVRKLHGKAWLCGL